jgi:hypothetical protein
VHREIHALFEEDQADRRGGLPADLHRRDERRRGRVEQLLAQGAVTDPDDLFFAAMVFQHGSDRAHYRRAHELARRAAELGSTRRPPTRSGPAGTCRRWPRRCGGPRS